ncbi:hypothetical protein RHGRI_028026 [Rhododendron griersonianum]|uniref:FHA domain-containing protein n=1 Tax=Rhododendron griersonianum TaxID=479676 RepID=A0AAV6IE21_9ERIC|nr:hypothetical protein RHGRI_028026 [Rhododendron griersonianum]
MGRTVPGTICVKVQKEDSNSRDDRISQLPSELLIIILGLLPFAKAASTCVLSKRWKYLWTFVKCLNFDFQKKLIPILRDPELGEVERPRYISLVNRVLQLHQGSHINEFKVNFPLAWNNSCDIDQWITFAITKRVQSLELDLQGSRIGVPPFPHGSPRYSFPEKVYSYIKSPCGLSCINCLTQLSLKFINVTGELVEHFLCNCPLLERLCVRGSKQLSKLRVIGPSLRLKFLEISACDCLESVDIYAPNLASFICLEMHARTQILVSYAPLLVDVTLGMPTVSLGTIERYFFKLESLCFSQLESLTLCMRLFRVSVISLILVNCTLSHFPELTNLKNLKLEVFASAGISFPDWTCLIKKSPSLHKFTLQIFYDVIYFLCSAPPLSPPTYSIVLGCNSKISPAVDVDLSSLGGGLKNISRRHARILEEITAVEVVRNVRRRLICPLDKPKGVTDGESGELGSHRRKWGNIQEPSKCIHKSLKVVEFVGNFDVDLAMYFIQNAITLQKIIVDCRQAFIPEREEFYKDDEWTEKSRNRALELKRMLPLGVELIIL